MSATETTQAVVARAYGGPEVLELIEVPVPEPDTGEVVIDVRAAGTNPFDHKRYSGMFGQDPAQLPMRLGGEVAGVIVATGGGTVDGPTGPLVVGDEVMANRVAGGYARRLTVPALNVLHKPETLTFAQASGLLLAGCTAVHALVAADVGSGDTLLLHGAAGGVGQLAVQLARLRGARVIGTGGADSGELLAELGAEPVRYGPGLGDRVRALAPDGVTCAIDAVGTGESLEVSLELVAERSRIVTLVGSEAAFGAGIKVIGGGPGADAGEAIRAAARVELQRLAAEGRLQVRVEAEYPLAQAAAAHIALGAGHAHGKIVLIP